LFRQKPAIDASRAGRLWVDVGDLCLIAAALNGGRADRASRFPDSTGKAAKQVESSPPKAPSRGLDDAALASQTLGPFFRTTKTGARRDP
jgi:hypothetical protein